MAYNVGRSSTMAPYASDASVMHTRDPTTQKAAQTTVTSVYQTHIAGYWRNVTVTWYKNLMNYSLNISVDSVDQNNVVYNCKIDLKPWHFWAKKGYKCLEVDGSQLEAYWDLKSAKFATGPEPISDYYVALVVDDEVVLLLGDNKKKAYKRTKARPALVEPVNFYKKENVFGKKSFSTRARFDQRKREHDIVVESSTTGEKDPEMWISIDGIILIHIQNLQWKFRGNQTVMVNKQPVEVFWDVHAWLFLEPGTHHGLFIFKSNEYEVDDDDNDSSLSGSRCDGSECSGASRYFSVQGQGYTKGVEFCLFLYAWKIE